MYNSSTIRIGNVTLTAYVADRKDSYRLCVGSAESLWEAQTALRKAGDAAAAKRLEMQCRVLAHRAIASYMLLAEVEAYHNSASAAYVEGLSVIIELSEGDSVVNTELLLASVLRLVERDAAALP